MAMSENEIIEKRFRVLAALWLLFCFFAAQQYAEASNLEGLFMRFFMYGIFAAPVWLVYGWKYLYGERQITRKILLLVGATYFAWACAADNHYSDDLNKQQILIFLSYVYFVVLAIPYSVIPTLLHKMRWKLIMATPPHTPMQSTPDEVLVLDLFWVRGVRKARGQPKDSLEAMGRDKILEIMRRVKKHWLEIIEGIKPETR
ncbi:MAG: hypothetical protein EBR02_05740, partial [Alphaproteobacteria bacterium]|nr:hypothetical protein [Alphaproteobacteria bacterium]